MCTDFENDIRNLLVPNFRSTAGMCEICKVVDTHFSPQLSCVYVHYKVILFVYCVYALVLLVQSCIIVVETL